jgi:hypothetical protein
MSAEVAVGHAGSFGRLKEKIQMFEVIALLLAIQLVPPVARLRALLRELRARGRSEWTPEPGKIYSGWYSLFYQHASADDGGEYCKRVTADSDAVDLALCAELKPASFRKWLRDRQN